MGICRRKFAWIGAAGYACPTLGAMRPMSALAVLFLAAITWVKAAAANPGAAAMSSTELVTLLRDPRGPATTLNSMSDEELFRALDALYRNLDTSAPELDALLWYETGLEECGLRNL